MGQPVKLSDALILDARLVGKAAERSIAGQIEFWARVGKAVEPLIRGDRALRLKEKGDAVPLSRLLATVDARAGRQRLEAHLAARPFPHFEPAPGRPGLLVRIEADGTRRVGRFVNRKFKVTDRK
jgi:hypothetical protein